MEIEGASRTGGGSGWDINHELATVGETRVWASKEVLPRLSLLIVGWETLLTNGVEKSLSGRHF